MTEPTERREKALRALVNGLRSAYGDELLSIIIHGSVVRGDYDTHRSDINLFVVLSEDGIGRLRESIQVVGDGMKNGIAPPVFVTKRYIEGALDAFPIEFLEMMSAYRVLTGEDPLASLVFERESVRLQAEREGRRFLLLLRRGYLSAAGDRDRLSGLIAESLPGYFALFRAMLWLVTGDYKATRSDLVKRVCDHFNLRYGLFEELEAVRRGGRRRSSDLVGLVESFLQDARLITHRLNDMQKQKQQ